MSGKLPVRLPPHRRPARTDARLVGAWLHRPAGAAPLSTAPALMTIVGTDFMDVFLSGVKRTGSAWKPELWKPLAAYRDWSELPRATRDLRGAAVLVPGLSRRALNPGELDGRDLLDPKRARPSGARDLDWALSSEVDGSTWIRKLYLPLHKHFTLISAELICDSLGQPPIDPARVVEVGVVVRRLILDRARERWEDWVVAPDGGGAWVELAGPVLDPRALPLTQGYVGDSDPSLRVRLGITDVTARFSLDVTSMAALPRTLGESNRHTAHFGVLPVMSRAMEKAPPTLEDETEARKALGDAVEAALTHALRDEVFGPWRARLQVAMDATIAAIKGWDSTKSSFDGARSIPFSVQVLSGLRDARLLLLRFLHKKRGLPEVNTKIDRALSQVVALGAEVEANILVAPPLTITGHDEALNIHRAGLELEQLCQDLLSMVSVGGAGAEAVLIAAAESKPSLAGSTIGQVLEVFLGFSIFDKDRSEFIKDVVAFYDPTATRPTPSSNPKLRAALRPRPPMPRFDPDHLYAAQCFARVRGSDPCEADQLVWSARTEPYQIADAMDVLGLQPTTLRLPDIPKLIADIPRIAKARAMPMVAVTTPPDSGAKTDKEAEETTREMGIAWICSFGIPVFTICAWIMFTFIFMILITIPGFAWMLLLKFCIPVPAPKRA